MPVPVKHQTVMTPAGVYTVSVFYDQDPAHPRKDYDNSGVMFYFRNRNGYELGDDIYYGEDAPTYVVADEVAISLPVYIYDHSGISISTTPFSCLWDSCQCGWIVMTAKTLAEEFNGDIEAATQCLHSEVSTFDDYLTGNVYGFVVEDAEGNEVDDCWSFYGAPKDALEEGISSAKVLAERHIKTYGLQLELFAE